MIYPHYIMATFLAMPEDLWFPSHKNATPSRFTRR